MGILDSGSTSVLIPGKYLVNIGESSHGKRSEQLGSARAPVIDFLIMK
ncbi:MAG TPA: hypothetical protein VFE71_09825 [Bacteroidales bacterium]|nr:hypothetical protein [Bacteroidales bacterium]